MRIKYKNLAKEQFQHIFPLIFNRLSCSRSHCLAPSHFFIAKQYFSIRSTRYQYLSIYHAWCMIERYFSDSFVHISLFVWSSFLGNISTQTHDWMFILRAIQFIDISMLFTRQTKKIPHRAHAQQTEVSTFVDELWITSITENTLARNMAIITSIWFGKIWSFFESFGHNSNKWNRKK